MASRITGFFSSGVLAFLVLKYFGLGLQFLATFLIAGKLGVYLYGIWSFILLFKQYLGYTTIGTNFSLNTILAVNFNQNNIKVNQQTFNNALLINIFLFIVLIALWLVYYFYPEDWFGKYHFKEYSLYLVLFVLFENLNQLFINLYRVYSRVLILGFFQLSIALSRILPVLFWSGEDLIIALLYFQLAFSMLACFMFFLNSPIRIGFQFNADLVTQLIKRGLNLLFYNLSFYFILISTKTLVSYYYSAQLFGEFGFAIQLASIVQVLLTSIAFLFYPKIINRLNRNLEISEIFRNLDLIREKYIYSHSFLTFVFIFISPVVSLFFNDYVLVSKLFFILLLINVSLSLSIGHSSLLIAWQKEKINTQNGIFAIVLNVVLFAIFHNVFLDLFWSLLSCLFSALVYSLLTIRRAERLIKRKGAIIDKHLLIFSIPFIVSIGIFSLGLENYFSILPLLIFTLLYRDKVTNLVNTGLLVLKSKNALKL